MNSNESRGEEKLKYFSSISRMAAVFFIGFSLFLVVSTIMLVILTKPEREVTVPDVEGKRFIEVYNRLVRKGIKPEIKFKDIADIDDGVILSQYPRGGKLIPENSRIKLVVSRSEYFIDVPKLVGKELPLALNNLRNIHRHDKTLSLGTGVISYMPSDSIADNIVIDQSPPAGEKITPDRKINLLVSSGKLPPDALMPGVTGQSIELCYDLLRAKGLIVTEEVAVAGTSSESGIVIAQTPAKGAAIVKGGICTLRVAWYPNDKHPYSSYEKIEYQIPADAPAGFYEAYINDSDSKRIRFAKSAGPGQKIVFVFRRQGNATISFRCNKKQIDDMDINVD